MRRRDLLSPGFLYYVLLAVFLYLPIVLLLIFSFNDSATLTFPLAGFTLLPRATGSRSAAFVLT